MGRGGRQDQAIGFSNPFRGRLARAEKPTEWGERQYHVRLVDGEGEVYDNPSKMREIKNTASNKGEWQIIESQGVRGEDGNLVWSEKALRTLPFEEYTVGYVNSVTQNLRQEPLGFDVRQETYNGSLSINLIERYNNDTVISSNYKSNPAKFAIINQKIFNAEASEEDIRASYGEFKSKADRLNLETTQKEQDRYLKSLATDKENRRLGEIAEKAEGDYQQMSEEIGERQEAWQSYVADKQEDPELSEKEQAKLTQKQAKRAQDTIRSLGQV